MFGFIRTSKHDAIVASFKADLLAAQAQSDRRLYRIDTIADERNDALREKRQIGRALAEKIAECERLSAELKVFHDRRDKAKGNLKQFRGSGSIAGGKSNAVLNA